MYLWELVGHDTAEGVLVSGIDGDLAAAMQAAAGLLTQPRGFVVRITEVVPRLSVLDLDEVFVPTGRWWHGRRTTSGGVHWGRADRPADPATAHALAAGRPAPGRAGTYRAPPSRDLPRTARTAA